MQTIKLYLKSLFVKAEPLHKVYPQFSKKKTEYATKRIVKKLTRRGYTCLIQTARKQVWFNGKHKLIWSYN